MEPLKTTETIVVSVTTTSTTEIKAIQGKINVSPNIFYINTNSHK